MADQLYSVAEVARLWGCSRQHVYDLITAGKLRTTDIGLGRARTRIPASALNEYVDKRSRRAA